jgi:hypothetical protein
LALFAGPFFIGHYGAFMVVHLLFIYALFQDGMDNRDSSAAEVFADFAILWPALLALFISHGISYVQNFIGRREYRGRQIRDQMGEPYKRIIVMHVTIIFGGMLTMMLGTLLPALAMLILLKTAVDLKAHLAEHGSGRAGPVNG